MAMTVAALVKHIDAYERASQKWERRSKRIVDRYMDDRAESESTAKRYNVLWSNIETLKPFLYSRTPKPVVRQRGDQTDPVARVASQVLERALIYTLAEEHFGTSMRNARDDYLLCGRGQAWARYVPEFKPAEPQVSEEGGSDDQAGSELGETEEVVAHEAAVTDYIHWRDFGHNVARTWEEVDVVWRRVRMDRKALMKRFPECGKDIPLDVKRDDNAPKSARTEEDETARAMIYEMWIKSEKRAVWLSKSYKEMLDDQPDPLQLDHFFPCPRPVYATLSTDSLIPVPDYVQYQDQAGELDDLTGRIGAITKALKAVGVYDASVPALEKILNDGLDNKLIAVDNWGALNEKGGIAGAVEMLPMKEIAETLIQLYEAREKVKSDLYEITGMSDIIRGNTAPEETATAQQIKSNFATKRLDERQREMERFARNAVDLLGNVIAVHFSPETLAQMTGMKLLPEAVKQQIMQAQQAVQAAQQAQGAPQGQPAPQMPPQSAMMAQQAQQFLQSLPPASLEAVNKPSWEDVIKLLRDHPRRRFSIDVETDSAVAADDQAEQQARVQFLQMAGQFLEQGAQITQEQPMLAPLLGKMLLFGVQAFRVGRDLQDDFEAAVEQMEKAAAQPKQQPPDPKMAQVEANARAKNAEMQQNQQLEQQRMAMDRQRSQMELQHEAQLEAMKAHFASQADQHKQAMEAQSRQAEAMIQATLDRWKSELDARTKVEVAEIAAGATLDAAEISAANQATEGGD
jgi:hypothetical protein